MKSAELDSFVQSLPQKDSFSRSELFALYKKKEPSLTPPNFSWYLSYLLKEGALRHFGKDLYTTKKILVYQGGGGDPRLERIRSCFKKGDYHPKMVVYASDFLNEWLNELIARPTILVEVPKQDLLDVFSSLKDHFPRATVLLNPTSEERFLYSKGDTIVVFPLASRSPMLLGNGMMCLEKLVVDLFADKTLRQFFSGDENPRMARMMLQGYHYDPRALHCYAQRRGVEKQILDVLASH